MFSDQEQQAVWDHLDKGKSRGYGFSQLFNVRCPNLNWNKPLY